MGSFSVFFDGQFWIGVATRERDGALEVARVVFGPEPSDAEMVEWAREAFGKLLFLPSRRAATTRKRAENPKRRQREAARATAEDCRTRTTAQDAWHEALAARKAAPTTRAHDRQVETERRYALQRAKRKKKRRGK